MNLKRFLPEITTRMTVWRQNWVKYGPMARPGSGYVEDWGSRNVLKKQWEWRGRVLWTKVIDTEDIPQHVVIARATIGYAGPWESKFAEYMK